MLAAKGLKYIMAVPCYYASNEIFVNHGLKTKQEKKKIFISRGITVIGIKKYAYIQEINFICLCIYLAFYMKPCFNEMSLYSK